jgi:hypothetical protein
MIYNLVEPGNKRGNHRFLQLNLRPKSVLSAVGHIEKPVFILFILIYCRHDSTCKQMTMSCTFTDPEADDKILWERLFIYMQELTCGWEDIIHKYKDCLFCTQLDSFADNIDKLSYSQVSWNKVPAFFRFSL